jgi:hypothetical protein
MLSNRCKTKGRSSNNGRDWNRGGECIELCPKDTIFKYYENFMKSKKYNGLYIDHIDHIHNMQH